MILQVVRAIDLQPDDTTVMPTLNGIYFDVVVGKVTAYNPAGDLCIVVGFMTGEEVEYSPDTLMIVARPLTMEVMNESDTDGSTEPSGTGDEGTPDREGEEISSDQGLAESSDD